MSLMTAHKILIAVSILFFFGYALRSLLDYFSRGNLAPLLGSGMSALAALGLAFYLRAFLRSLRR